MPLVKAVAYCNTGKPLNAVGREKLNYMLIWLLNAGGRVTTVLILKLYVKIGGWGVDKDSIGDSRGL